MIDITAILPNLTHPDDYINIVSGTLLLISFFVLFIYRAYPVLKNGTIPEKTAIVFSSIYPLVYCAFGTFYSLVSYNFKSVFALSFLMYAMNNLQLSITYKDNIKNIIPDKLKNTNIIIFIVVLFCAFFFKSRI